MIARLQTFLKKHSLISIYSFVIIILFIGVYAHTGAKHIPKLIIYTISLFATYFLLHKLGLRNFGERSFDLLKNRSTNHLLNYFLIGITALVFLGIIGHLLYLGNIPVLEAFDAVDRHEAAKIRRNISAGSPRILNYLVSFNLRALIPFLILTLLIKQKERLFWIVLLVASFYCFSLMQKSLIFTIIIPVFIYALFKRKIWHILAFILIISLVIIGQFTAANPSKVVVENSIEQTIGDEEVIPDSELNKTIHNRQLDEVAARSKDSITQEVDTSILEIVEVNDDRFIARFSGSIFSRIAFLPGKTVSEWFEIIPSKMPFLHGDGYRMIARIKGTQFRNYFLELYAVMYPEHAANGLKGSVNTASFVLDYANFGKAGLVMGGIILAIFLVFIEILFKDDFILKLSLNAFPVLLLSSTSITIALFSGGWGLIFLLYFVFFGISDKESI